MGAKKNRVDSLHLEARAREALIACNWDKGPACAWLRARLTKAEEAAALDYAVERLVRGTDCAHAREKLVIRDGGSIASVPPARRSAKQRVVLHWQLRVATAMKEKWATLKFGSKRIYNMTREEIAEYAKAERKRVTSYGHRVDFAEALVAQLAPGEKPGLKHGDKWYDLGMRMGFLGAVTLPKGSEGAGAVGEAA